MWSSKRKMFPYHPVGIIILTIKKQTNSFSVLSAGVEIYFQAHLLDFFMI
jgi:hypothetical protein